MGNISNYFVDYMLIILKFVRKLLSLFFVDASPIRRYSIDINQKLGGNTMKKKLAILLSVILSFMLLPSAAFAAGAGEMVPVVVKTPEG